MRMKKVHTKKYSDAEVEEEGKKDTLNKNKILPFYYFFSFSYTYVYKCISCSSQ